MDEQLTPQMSGLFLGLFYLAASVGPAIGFGLGKPFLSLPVTLNYDQNSLSNNHESFIGAWWLGYILGGTLLMIVATFIVLFPSFKPKQKRKISTEKEPIVTQQKIHKPFWIKLKEYFLSFRHLFKNIPYMCLILGMGIEGIAINGIANFLSKILEVQFRLSSANASIMAGISAVGGAGVGAILGGTVIKFMGTNPKKKAMLLIVISSLACCFFAAFFIGCDKRILKINVKDNMYFR